MTSQSIPTVVPTWETRRAAAAAITRARRDDGFAAALEFIPKVAPDQRVAFVAVLLQACKNSAVATTIEPSSALGGFPRTVCRDCCGDRTQSVGGRGLCRSCYDHHRYAGTLSQFPKASALCGTDSGYRRHRRDDERACEACLEAHSAAERARGRRQREEESA